MPGDIAGVIGGRSRWRGGSFLRLSQTPPQAHRSSLGTRPDPGVQPATRQALCRVRFRDAGSPTPASRTPRKRPWTSLRGRPDPLSGGGLFRDVGRPHRRVLRVVKTDCGSRPPATRRGFGSIPAFRDVPTWAALLGASPWPRPGQACEWAGGWCCGMDIAEGVPGCRRGPGQACEWAGGWCCGMGHRGGCPGISPGRPGQACEWAWELGWTMGFREGGAWGSS